MTRTEALKELHSLAQVYVERQDEDSPFLSNEKGEMQAKATRLLDLLGERYVMFSDGVGVSRVQLHMVDTSAIGRITNVDIDQLTTEG